MVAIRFAWVSTSSARVILSEAKRNRTRSAPSKAKVGSRADYAQDDTDVLFASSVRVILSGAQRSRTRSATRSVGISDGVLLPLRRSCASHTPSGFDFGLRPSLRMTRRVRLLSYVSISGVVLCSHIRGQCRARFSPCIDIRFTDLPFIKAWC